MTRKKIQKRRNFLEEIERLKEFLLQSPQLARQMAQNVSESAKLGNIVPALLNTINTPQRLVDEMRGVSYNTRTPRGSKGKTTESKVLSSQLPYDEQPYDPDPIGIGSLTIPRGVSYNTRTPRESKGKAAESKVLPSQLPYDEKPYDPIGIGSLTIPSRTTFRNPFLREGYLENPLNQTSYFGNKDSQLRDVEYFLRNLATDPRSSWARNALIGTLGGLGYAAYKNEPQEQKPYTYDIGANSPEYMQYLGNRRIPSKQTNPYVYQSMDTNYLNRPSKQPYKNFSEAKKIYQDALFADQGIMQTEIEDLLKDYYGTTVKQKFRQVLKENPEMTQEDAMRIASSEIIPVAHEAYKYVSPYFQDPNFNAIQQATTQLVNERFANYLNTETEKYRTNVLGGRSDDELDEKEKAKLEGIQFMLKQNYINQYNNERYLEDLSTVVSNQILPQVTRLINETYKQRLYKPEQKKVKSEQEKYLPADKQAELDKKKQEWYRTTPILSTLSNAISPIDESEYEKFKIPYFIPESELDKKIMSRALTAGLEPQRFLSTRTPKSVKEKFDTLIQKPFFKRASKKQSHDIIQKSLAPKYQLVSKNKYLKEK